MGKAVEQLSSPMCCIFLSFGTNSCLSYTSLGILDLLLISMPPTCHSLAHWDHHSLSQPSTTTMSYFWMAWSSMWLSMHRLWPLFHLIWHSGITNLHTTIQLTSNHLWSAIWWLGCILTANLQLILYANHALLARCMQIHLLPCRIAAPALLSLSIPIHAKLDIFNAFKQFKAFAENQTEWHIKTLWDNKRGEYMSKVMLKFTTQCGIECQHTIQAQP